MSKDNIFVKQYRGIKLRRTIAFLLSVSTSLLSIFLYSSSKGYFETLLPVLNLASILLLLFSLTYQSKFYPLSLYRRMDTLKHLISPKIGYLVLAATTSVIFLLIANHLMEKYRGLTTFLSQSDFALLNIAGFILLISLLLWGKASDTKRNGTR